MDGEHFHHELDQDLDLDGYVGDIDLPPVEEPAREPGGGPRLPIAEDPEVPWLTAAIVGCLCAFGGLSLLILTSGGSGGAGSVGGEGLAWLLGGSFAVLYVFVFWAGAAFIGRHRYR